MIETSPKATLDSWSGQQVRVTTCRVDDAAEQNVGNLDPAAWAHFPEGGAPVPSGVYRVGSLTFDIGESEEEPVIEDGRVVLVLAQGVVLTVELASAS